MRLQSTQFYETPRNSEVLETLGNVRLGNNNLLSQAIFYML
jgi:hypothetical protein